METEYYCSGYCRVLDGHRTVEVLVTPDGVEADCLWPDCVHKGSCLVAQAIEAGANP